MFLEEIWEVLYTHSLTRSLTDITTIAITSWILSHETGDEDYVARRTMTRNDIYIHGKNACARYLQVRNFTINAPANARPLKEPSTENKDDMQNSAAYADADKAFEKRGYISSNRSLRWKNVARTQARNGL